MELNVHLVNDLPHKHKNISNTKDIHKCTKQSSRPKICHYASDVSRKIDNKFSSASQNQGEKDKLTIQGLRVHWTIVQHKDV